jgi:branched-chain amino acid transport system ATP-binding protein
MRELLRLEGVVAGYGAARVLGGISLVVQEGEALAVLGRNGMGKTTLINTIVGLTRQFAGSISLAGRDITRLHPVWRARAGLGWVPEQRNIFKSLTAEENLTAVARPGPWTVERIWRLFPQLEARRSSYGHQLSGGEQQMLAIGRALVLNPKLLLLDEPTEGIAPIVAEGLLRTLVQLFREKGMAGIVVEQHAHKVLGISDRAVILERGAIVHADASANLRNDGKTLARYLGITDHRHVLARPPPAT